MNSHLSGIGRLSSSYTKAAMEIATGAIGTG